MREASLLCHLKRYVIATTHAQHGEGRYPNLLKTLIVQQLNQAWVADLTYIRLPGEFVYLAAILDAYSRRCIGWAVSREITTAVTLAALEQALRERQPAAGLIHHSDQGVQYASAAYTARLQQAGLVPSISAKGNPYDNAKAERFFRTMVQLQIISFV
jgi:transposase InsO family protein